MDSVSSRQAGKRDFDVLTQPNLYDNQPTEPPDRQENPASLASLYLDDTA